MPVEYDYRKKRERKFIPTMCFQCDHCSKTDMKQGMTMVEQLSPSQRKELGIKKKSITRFRILRKCTLFDMWVGESSATCEQGTNIIKLP